jgi:hypothetical protein
MTTERLGVSILGRKGDKFDGKLKSLRAASELVDKEIQTRGELVGVLSCARNPADLASPRKATYQSKLHWITVRNHGSTSTKHGEQTLIRFRTSHLMYAAPWIR